LMSGCRMSSRPSGGPSRDVFSPGFPRPSGFGHPGLCLSRPPGGHMQSSLPAAAGSSGFSLPQVVQASGCRLSSSLIYRASCKRGGTVPLIEPALKRPILEQATPHQRAVCRASAGRRQGRRCLNRTAWLLRVPDYQWTSVDAHGRR
jgi:hypothetical protein